MSKLTDAQLVMMGAAAQREDRCLAAPETMKGAAVSKVGAKLVKLGFARETHAKPGTPLWRRDETGRSFALKLTAAGLKAIAVDEGPQDAIEPGEASQPQLLPEAKNGVSLDDAGRRAPTAAPRDGSNHPEAASGGSPKPYFRKSSNVRGSSVSANSARMSPTWWAKSCISRKARKSLSPSRLGSVPFQT